MKNSDETRTGRQIRGVVLFSDGRAPQELVEIIAACPAFHRLLAVVDSKGKFSFGFDSHRQLDLDLTKGCNLYASLEGYRSKTTSLADLNTKSGDNLDSILLEPISTDPSGLSSAADSRANAAQRKAYQKALDKAAQQDWRAAGALLQEIVSADPGYSSAWLTLGQCQQTLGDRDGAEKSYLAAVRIDPTFALPLLRAAAIEAARGDMQAALVHSQKAIDLNPGAFPDAYSLNAVASMSVQQGDTAEKNARAGLALDPTHQYPELEYALGMILSTKDDGAEAKKHLQLYVAEAPNGPNVLAAKKQIEQMQRSDSAVTTLAAAANAQAAGPVATNEAGETLPDTGSLQTRNAPLLKNSSAYTCLESIMPAKVDIHGRLALLDTLRIDIAVSGGKEIYGSADGKHFSSGAQRDLLAYSFSTTGLFSSVARALIAADQFAVEPAGQVAVNGQTLLRYNFHSLASTAGWTISYGKESGRAAEEGWFLIDGESQILRRVFIAATNIPSNLKLIHLSALVDYETETLAGHRVLLPRVARMQVGERSGVKHISLVSFDHCRAFSAESTLSFEDAESRVETDKPITPARLPLNTEILVSFTSPVSIELAQANDLITATVAKPVLQNGHELIASGAAVEGHIWKRPENVLVVQLDRVWTSSGWVPFYAQLVKLGSNRAQIQDSVSHAHPALFTSDNNAELSEPDIPGVATLTLATKETELLSGTQMVWKTQSLLVEHKEVSVPQLNTSVALQ